MSKQARWMKVLVLFLAFGSILAGLTGCTNLFPKPARESVAPNSTTISENGSAPQSKSAPVDLTKFEHRVIYGIISRSPEFAKMESQFIGVQPTDTVQLSESFIGVIFDLAPEGMPSVHAPDFRVYSYAIFIVDLPLRKVVEVISCVPNLKSMDVQFRFSRRPEQDEKRNMSPCVIRTLTQIQERVQEQRKQSRGGVIAPKRMCEPGLEYPKTVCTCEETVPGHEDWGCFSDCTLGCSAAVGSIAQALCDAACYGLCYVPAYCSDLYCITLYPC